MSEEDEEVEVTSMLLPPVRWQWIELPIALFTAIGGFFSYLSEALKMHYNFKSREFMRERAEDHTGAIPLEW